ncbi:MAG: NUDIX domain-containing protein [Bacteroidetes bacterium]|nr:NUDIX domain-containing protein [Bacteroidota bacterium]
MKNINSQLFDNEDVECYQFQSKRALLAVIADFIDKRITHELYIYCPTNLREVFLFFVSQYTEVKAGGGLVKNLNEEYLFIFRRAYWDLPKGKKDWGEPIRKCAIREVEEETGIDNIEIIKKLPNTYHIYTEKNKQIIKHCYWYLMKTTTEKKLVPQIKEDITKAVWLKKEEIPEVLRNSYPSINYLVYNYLNKFN